MAFTADDTTNEATTGAVRAALGVLAAVDWKAVGDDELAGVVVDLVKVRTAVESVTAPVVREYHSRRLWAGDGSKSPRARRARDAHCDPRTTGRMVRTADALPTCR